MRLYYDEVWVLVYFEGSYSEGRTDAMSHVQGWIEPPSPQALNSAMEADMRKNPTRNVERYSCVKVSNVSHPTTVPSALRFR